MSKPVLPRLRYFESSPGQQHITAEDHYLYRRQAPAYRINIIGTGTIGQEHMRVATAVGGACVHGVYDVATHSMDVAESNHRASCSDTLKRYADLESACNDTDVHGLVICTPNYTHLDVLKVAMSSGKPILLEKPMATTLADAAEILQMAADYPAGIQVGLQYRYKAIYAEALHEVQQRRSIGQLHSIAISEHRPPFLDKVGQWNKFSKYSGGTLVEKCCHYFDLMNLFAEAPPKRVVAFGSQAVNFVGFERDGAQSDILDNASVLIEYRNGIQANFSLNMFAPQFHEEMVICGNAGRLKAEEHFDFLQAGGSQSVVTVEQHEPLATRKTSLGYPQHVEQSGHHGATWFEHLAFLHMLAGEPGDAAGAAQGFWSIVVGAAAEESVRSGNPVDINEYLEAAGLSSLAAAHGAYWSSE